MDRWATKDHYEREEEEADRLVRPDPKIKPPRHDRRREEMWTDRDPDIEGDLDVAKDPDLSLNRKEIGGSTLVQRVLVRFLQADAPPGGDGDQLVKVRHKGTGRVVNVKKKTLQEKPGDYEEYKEEPGSADDTMSGGWGGEGQGRPKGKHQPEPEEVEPEDGPKAGPGEKNEEFYQGAGREMYDAAETDLQFGSILKGIADPSSDLGNMAVHAPQMPVAPFLHGRKVPEGIETIGDLQKAALHGRKGPAGKGKPKAPKPGGEPKKPGGEPKAEPPKKGEPGEETPPKASEAPADKAPEKGKPREKGQPPPLPSPKDQAKALQDSQSKRIVERFKAEKGAASPEWQDHLKDLPTTTTDKDGKPVFIDPKTKKDVPFESLPPKVQAQLISNFESKRLGDATADAFRKALVGNNAARSVVEGLFDPESPVSKKIADLRKQGHDPDALPASKNFPELADVLPKEVRTVGDVQRLVQSRADYFQPKEPWKQWVEGTGGDGPESPLFREYARKRGFQTDDTGKVLVPLGKKAVPWDGLSDELKAKVYADYSGFERASKWSKDLLEAAHSNHDLAAALYQLGNPTSQAAQGLSSAKDMDDKKVARYLPALRELKLPAGMTFGDLVATAKETFKPVAPPQRKKATDDELKSAQMALYRTFDHYPKLAAHVELLGLHPTDIQQIIGTFNRAKVAKIQPDQLDARIKEAQDAGLYQPDPTAILPPKSGRNAKGKVTAWGELTPEEQSEAYARHRNDVIATTAALREQVTATLRDTMGVPQMAAKTLAMAKLSRQPGESRQERHDRAKVLGKKIVENVLRSGKKGHPITDYDVKTTLASMGDDPLARNFAVAYFQANDYQLARDKFLDSKSPTRIDEREHPRQIAARLKEANAFFQKQDKRYPPEARTGSMAERFRHRILSRIMALHPEKGAEIGPEIEKLDADEWDSRKAEYDKHVADFKKDAKKYELAKAKAEKEVEAEISKQDGGYRKPAGPVKSVSERLAEAKVLEPLAPEPLPMKPAGYDLVRKDSKGQQQSGQSLWRRLLKGLTASERVAGRFLYSSCAPVWTMGSPASSDRHASEKTGVYWGVDPTSKEKAVNVPYTPWQQAQARDLGEKDYNAILAGAREWMKVPVLARILDEKDSLGAVRDIQLRAALDLAIRDVDGGKYSVGLYPTVYNELLARLAGKSTTETLVTQREASRSLYSQATGEDRPMNAASQIRKFAAEIAATHPGLAFDLTNLAFKVAEQEQQQEKDEKDDKKEDKGKFPDFLKDKDAAAAKYAEVKAAVIRTASANPTIRTALVPVLQLLKQHQGG